MFANTKNEALVKGEALLRKVEPGLFLVKVVLKCRRADVIVKKM